ncbi:Mixed lineage kinase domain-like protein [Xyrichtys novacula]|uniref:Mixed lineage kinase domain-like protein n=1 Tax=Xyrichtys novacula TaxID=13765 RepID=A0AAV1F4J3_XYRNO|nr:Mixed lineage kinase domain-like protein [Xyrichtys novacula]
MDLQPVNGLISNLESLFNDIYREAANICVKRELFQEIARRAKDLEHVVLRFQYQVSSSVKNALEDLSITLEDINQWMMTVSSYGTIGRFVKSGKCEEDFNKYVRKLYDHHVFLSDNVPSTMGRKLAGVQQRISPVFDVSGPSLPVVGQTGPLFDPRSYATPPLNTSFVRIDNLTVNVSSPDQLNLLQDLSPLNQIYNRSFVRIDKLTVNFGNPNQSNPFISNRIRYLNQ